ncbi:MAG: efflux RND transporter permease subunit [Desulfosalsimonadaceae bacterium]
MPGDRPLPSAIVKTFLEGNLAILMIVISLLAGTAALLMTPREEEPQIVVPVADVYISFPGASAAEVEQTVSSRLEKLLYQIDGVEYVYSMSRPGEAVVTVRFYVGESREGSLIKLYNKLFSNIDEVTPGITDWVVKPIEIDDVPIVSATLYSDRYGHHELCRTAEEITEHLQQIKNTARITIHGGQPRVLHVYLDNDRLASYGLSHNKVMAAIRAANVQGESGMFERANETIRVGGGPFLHDREDVNRLMVGVHGNMPIFLKDVANIQDGPDEITSYTRLGYGPGSGKPLESFPAVTVAVAKKSGSNAVNVARQVRSRIKRLEGSVIADDIHVDITRDYGRTANEKVNSLVISLGLAIVTVIGLLSLVMGWRSGVIVAIAVPITYSLTLLFNMYMGFTINRVTLFALILTIGLLVDDPIVVVENIYRHLRMRLMPVKEAIFTAMDEIMPPVILSTLAVVVSFVPMFYITGMMGPYMAPMAINVPAAVFFSTVVALAITPTLSRMILRVDPEGEKPPEVKQTRMYGIYNYVMRPLIESPRRAYALLAATAVLFFLSAALPAIGLVPLKMLPFDNKNEFQLVIDMPENATLEKTDEVVSRIEEYLRTQAEVTNFTSFVGTPSPMDFNSMIRQYYMRQGPHTADIRVNLVHHTKREFDSHAFVLRIRNDIENIARDTGANIKLVETPPGPPVLATVVAEVYGDPRHSYDDLVRASGIVRARMHQEEGVVDIDTSVETPMEKLFFRVDHEKAALNGVYNDSIINALRMATHGITVDTLHVPTEQNEIPIVLRLPRESRSSRAQLEKIQVTGRQGNLIEIGELGHFEETFYDRTIHHKNLERVVYVTAEMAGKGPTYAILNLQSHFKKNPLAEGIHINWRGEGEWKITVDVFRDLGIAFSAALVGIYAILVYQCASYLIPVVIMLSIPLTMIGIMPGFWLLNVLVDRPVGGFDNPVFFTATAMIGMIALAGIVVRNALVLINFIQTSEARGISLKEAVLESGAVRMRPILLTAVTTMLGAWPITLDPIFSGLAWALIFGLFVSTAFTLLVVPLVYYLLYGEKPGKSQEASQ